MRILTINLSQTILTKYLTNLPKYVWFWWNIFNMFSKICNFLFELVKLWQIIKLNARYLENKTKLRMSFRNYFNYYIRTGYSKHWKSNTPRYISIHYVSCVNKTTCYKICKQNAGTKKLFLFCLFYFYYFVVYKVILIMPFVSFF
jgi:hypothetical protein